MDLARNIRGYGEPTADTLLLSHLEDEAMTILHRNQAVEIVPGKSHVRAKARLQDRIVKEETVPYKPPRHD